MIESSNQFSFIKKGSTIRASFRLIKILIKEGSRYTYILILSTRERKKEFFAYFFNKKRKVQRQLLD